ncbi:MAG: FAD-dependent oxidoreductase [Leptospiraceae bacterium]|nr:FAD-dependent oxidoreductase [Leptospiraceae bacterium]
MIDVLIIGGGIVGSWIALRAARRGLTVAVCDQSANPGDATSGRNSGVLHAGIYYTPGSKKAQHCIKGYALTLEYLKEHSLPHTICGKLITTGDQLGPDTEARLQSIFENACSIGARDLTILRNPGSIYNGVLGDSAILSPHTGVCDAAAYLKSVQNQAREAGAIWLLGRRLISVSGDRALVSDEEGRQEEIQSALFVNSAGLNCDEVARMTGLDEYEIVPVRGEYYRLRKAHPVNMLVYPLPDPSSTALGVHYTFHPGGDAYAGPNAVAADSREDYRITQSRTDFAESLSRILSGYAPEDLSPGYAGIRPRLRVNGVDYRDFLIRRQENFIHLLGIESPGLTSAASLSEEVMELL